MHAFDNRSLTFCIAAKNEQDTLPGIVNRVRTSQTWLRAKQRELLIYVNGSTDATATVAQRLTQQDTDIRVFLSEIGSKGRAWNQLVPRTNPQSEYLIFLDADIDVGEHTFDRLLQALDESPALNLVGACAQPVPPERTRYGFIQRRFAEMLAQATIVERRVRIGLVPGCCYAIRRSAALQVTLPEEASIGEDTALNALFSRSKTVVADAPVYFIPPNFIDRVRVSARHRRSFLLLKTRYPSLHRAFTRSYSQPFRRSLLADFCQMRLRHIPAALLAFGAMVVGTILCHRLVRKPELSWHTPLSTKLRIGAELPERPVGS